MKKPLPIALLLLTTLCTHAQTSPSPGTLPAAEVLKYQRQHDSMQVVIAKRRKEIGAYNRTHPAKKPAAKPVKR